MSALIATFWPYVLAAAVAIGAIWKAYASGKTAGADKMKAKEAENRAKNLDKIKDAADAGSRVRPDDGLHNDPYNRDR